jgi:hypothetical protein
MPDADGNFKPVSVPRVPWHDKPLEQTTPDELADYFREFDLSYTEWYEAGMPSKPKRDELAIQRKMLKAWKAENTRTSGCYWPD